MKRKGGGELSSRPTSFVILSRGSSLIRKTTKYYQDEGKIFLQNLIEKLSDINCTKICKFGEYLDMSKENISRSENKKDTPSQIIINNENNNTANAKASNENIITISTLSQLSNQVSQSTMIENKIEIQELISQLEDAKDEGNEDSYFDLFFKLLEET